MLGRRQFLTGAAAAAALVAAGCSSSDADADAAKPTTTRAAKPAAVTVPTTAAGGVDLATNPFTLGVASGDPLSDRVILWTRLAPDPVADDGRGGMAAASVPVIWEVATDERFTRLVAAGVVTATAEHGHSVHVDAKGLEPGTDYHYRFTVGSHTSLVGRTRTLQTGSPDQFTMAVVNCQMYETGFYGAYRHLADEDVDVVLHLGDYIYELPGGDSDRSSKPNRFLTTLTDYRLRYASYKLDADLQASHVAHPWVLTWDDHEVANNYMGDTIPGDPDASHGRARKAAAYKAWWEHQPVRLPAPDGSNLAVYRAFAVGDLTRVHVLDERQDADQPPCRPAGGTALDYGDCDARLDEDRSRLGTDQERWLTSSLAEGGVTWNLLGNPVVLAGVNAGKDTDAYYLDTWDGFPQARERLIAQLADVDNPVVLTGDYHAGMVLDVHAKPFEQSSKVVATEFMSPPISSLLFPDDISARTPQLREQLNEHGYLTVSVTPEELTVAFRVLADVGDPKTAISTPSTWKVAKGNPVATKA